MTAIESAWKRTAAGQPRPGAHAERRRTTTMRDVESFTEMTGDSNPIHYDTELAAKTPFGGLVVQGGVTTGLLNAVVAEDLPGPGTVFLETNWKFVKAVRVGEAERDRIVQRILDVKRDQKRRGRHLGGKRPFGFKMQADGSLIEDEREQAAIGKIKTMKAEGASLRSIQAALQADGHKLSHVTVNRILK